MDAAEIQGKRVRITIEVEVTSGDTFRDYSRSLAAEHDLPEVEDFEAMVAKAIEWDVIPEVCDLGFKVTKVTATEVK